MAPDGPIPPDTSGADGDTSSRDIVPIPGSDRPAGLPARLFSHVLRRRCRTGAGPLAPVWGRAGSMQRGRAGGGWADPAPDREGAVMNLRY